jgi:hypothetical protein
MGRVIVAGSCNILFRRSRTSFCHECIPNKRQPELTRGLLALSYLAERWMHYEGACGLFLRTDLVGQIGCVSGNEIAHGTPQI